MCACTRPAPCRSALAFALIALTALVITTPALQARGGAEATPDPTTVRAWQLAFAAQSQLATAPETALLLAYEALARHADAVTDETMRQALEHVPWQSVGAVTGAGPITDADFSPDGRRLLTISGELHPSTVRVWDLANGRLVTTLKPPLIQHPVDPPREVLIRDVIFSPDGRKVWICSDWGELWVWEGSGTQLKQVGKPLGSFGQARLSRDGRRIATNDISYKGEPTPLRVWDTSTRKELLTLDAGHTFTAFSPDGQRMVAIFGDPQVLDVATGKVLATLNGHVGDVFTVSFSPDGAHIVTTTTDGTARVWDAASGRLLALLRNGANRLWRATFSPDGRQLLAISSDHTALLWDLASERLLAMLQGHVADLTRAQFSADGTRIFTAAADGTARVWAPATNNATAVLQPPMPPQPGDPYATQNVRVGKLSFTPDGRYLIVGYANGGVQIWDVERPTKPVTLPDFFDSVRDIYFSADGTRVLMVGYGGNAGVWDTQTWLQVNLPVSKAERVAGARLTPAGGRYAAVDDAGGMQVWDMISGKRLAELQGFAGSIIKVDFSPDGSRLITLTSDASARLWNAATGALIANFNPCPYQFEEARFSPDGRRIVTHCGESSISLLDGNNGRLIKHLPGGGQYRPFSLAFSPNGHVLAVTWNTGEVQLLDTADGKKLGGLQSYRGGLGELAFSSDGRLLASTVADTILMWEASSRTPLATIGGYDDYFADIALSPDGRLVAVGGDKGLLRIDLLDSAALLRLAACRVGRPLTAGEIDRFRVPTPLMLDLARRQCP